jgi:hydroxyacylglutathione hydrolase
MNISTAAVGPFYKNGYLVACEQTADAVLIDPGDEIDELVDLVREKKLNVRAILLTHAHFDHVVGVARAKAACPAPVWLHADDQLMYDSAVEQARAFGVAIPAPPPVDRYYEPGAPLAFGTYVVDVLPTPGHCPGGVCLAIGRRGAPARELFVGDTLFAGSIGRTDFPGCDHDALMRSIRDVLFAFPDDTPVHPGHGPSTTIGIERRSNPFLITSA